MTRKAPRQKRMDDILEAAVNEFVEKGYDNASMEAIATRAGLTKGGLYHHFSSKEEILIAANSLFMQPVYDCMDKAKKKKTAPDALRLYIRSYLAYWETHPQEIIFVFLSLVKMLSSQGMWPLYKTYYTEMRSFFETLLTQGIDQGDFAPHDTRARSVALMSALDGAIGYLIMVPEVTLASMTAWFDEVFIRPIMKA